MSGVWGTIVGVVVIIGIGVPASIALHELGHMIPAKKFGVACSQYMIGFGPTIWSRRRGETEYGIKAIPLGGYVRMLGMLPPASGRAVQADSTGRLGLLIDRARRDAQADIGPEDRNRLFYQRPAWQRLIIMFGGPLMNLVLALIMISLLATTYGLPAVTIGEVTDNSAAAAAGLQKNDRLVSVDGEPVNDWTEVSSRIRSHAGQPMSFVVNRNGTEVTLVVSPKLENRQAVDQNNTKLTDPDGKPIMVAVGFAGIQPAFVNVKEPITAVPGYTAELVGRAAGVIIRLPQRMVGVAQAAFGTQARDPQGPVGMVGVTRLAGEAGSLNEITFSDKLAFWLSMVAMLNISLFVFNLIPLLPLDGGHIAGVVWESIRKGWARLRHRPNPGPVDIAKLLPLTYGVAAVLIAMSVMLLYADIVNPIKLQ